MSTLDPLALKVTRPYQEDDLPAMAEIWNEIVEAGNAFPQTEPLTLEEARIFFAEQSHTAVATVGGRIRGLYILHPNNIGRCGHVANASFAVAGASRGEGIGRLLVEDCLRQAGASALREPRVRAHRHDSRRLPQQRRRLRGYVHLLSPDGVGLRLKHAERPRGDGAVGFRWCPRRDLNPHTFRQRFLRPSCLPFHHSGSGAPVQYSGRARQRRGEIGDA